MKVIILLLALVLGTVIQTKAQHLASEKNSSAAGIGIGLPYGGIGARISYNPFEQTALFLGMGYNFAGVGINGGLQYILPSSKQTEVYFTAMYGANASIVIEGWGEFSKNYYGPSLGLGVRINSLRNEGSFWDVGIIVPIRSSSFNDDFDDLENSSFFSDLSRPWPVLITVGYNFSLVKRKD